MTFTAHMAWHMALVTVLAPLAACVVRMSRFDPVAREPWLFTPLLACFIEFVVVWMWHLPPLHVSARHDAFWFAVEQGSFAIAATYFWMTIVGGAPVSERARRAAGLIALVVTFAHMTMLGALIALAPRLLYEHGTLEDQRRGGAVMILVAAIVYPLTAAWMARGLVTASAGRRA